MIQTYSAFTYGHTITDDNKFLDIELPSQGVVSAELNIGSYTLSQFSNEVARALNAAALNVEFTTSLNRTTRTITISGSATFSLLVSSGATSQSSAYPLVGFTGTDQTGASSYVADSPSGSVFEPQFYLQDYIDFQDDQEALNVSVNETPSGVLEVIKFGDVNFMTCNITLQKNQSLDEPRAKGNFIKFSETGESDLRKFMQYITTKAPIEFIKNIDDFNTFEPCLLERSSKSSNGTGFTLRELYTRGLANWYESGTLVFRKLIL